MENSSDVTLSSICAIISSLTSVVAQFYGPQCSQTLLTSQTGKAVVTSDGYTIVEALHPEHPLADLIFKSLKQCHQQTQDGCKLFLLYLNNIFKELDHAIQQGLLAHNGENKSGSRVLLNKHGSICARGNIRKFKSDVLPRLCAKLLQNSLQLVESQQTKWDHSDIIRNIIKTTLMPHYNPKLCEFFGKLLVTLFHEEDKCVCRDKFLTSLRFIVHKFYGIIVKISSRPYGESTVCEPLLVKRKFTVKCEGLNSKPIKAVMLVSGMDQTCAEEDRKEVFQIKQRGQLTKMLLYRQKMVEIFADKCDSHGVNLVLCSEEVPPYAADILKRKGISVIAYVLPEDIDLLEQLSNSLRLVSIKDDIAKENIVNISGVNELIIGGEMYLQLKMNTVSTWKHLIICGPTVGLCDQVAMMCQKALTAVQNSFMSLNDVSAILSEISMETNAKPNSTKIGDGVKEIKIEEVTSKTRPLRQECSVCRKSFGSVSKCLSYGDGNEIVIIQGGGSFELLLAYVLKSFRADHKDTNLNVICNVLEIALKNVVQNLYVNTTTETDKKRGFLECLTSFEEQLKLENGAKLLGIDRRGRMRDLKELNVFEPLNSKMHVLSCVLDLVDQLLGVDRIVSVRKIPTQDSDDDNNDDNDFGNNDSDDNE